MTPHPCPDLEVLFAELDAGEGLALDHAAECEACSAVLEEHRLMEQDLFRLADFTTVIIATERFAAAVARLGLEGVVFKEVPVI